MNNIETFKILATLADQLDQHGYKNQANYVDNMLLKLADDAFLKPISDTYVDGGKHYRKFMDLSKGTLVVREVTPNGVLIGKNEEQSKAPSTTEQSSDTSWSSSLYSTFDEIASALLGKTDESTTPTKPNLENKVKDSKKENKKEKKTDKDSDMVDKYLKELVELKKKLHDLGVNLLEEPTQLMVSPLTEYTIIDEPTLATRPGKSFPGLYDELVPELTELSVHSPEKFKEITETEEATQLIDADDVSNFLQLVELPE
jgi:hypothetical protein